MILVSKKLTYCVPGQTNAFSYLSLVCATKAVTQYNWRTKKMKAGHGKSGNPEVKESMNSVL